MALSVAVDIGGTFTDLLRYDDTTGQIYHGKSSTTPRDLTQGILRCLEKSRLAIKDLVHFVHGSTVAINTVIERKGARTALGLLSIQPDFDYFHKNNSQFYLFTNFLN